MARIGRVPWGWYENYKHIGYDADLKKIMKKKQDDKIDEFINKSENVNWWRTIRDELNQQDIILTDDQLDVLERIRAGKFANRAIAENDYSVEYEWNEGHLPLSSAPPPKRRFLPSKWERIKVNKIVQAIRLGRISLDKTPKEREDERVWDIWDAAGDDKADEIQRKLPPAILAPKMKLPGHAES